MNFTAFPALSRFPAACELFHNSVARFVAGSCKPRRVGKRRQSAGRLRHSASRDENGLLTKVIGFKELDNELALQGSVL